jgi:glutaredoxin
MDYFNRLDTPISSNFGEMKTNGKLFGIIPINNYTQGALILLIIAVVVGIVVGIYLWMNPPKKQDKFGNKQSDKVPNDKVPNDKVSGEEGSNKEEDSTETIIMIDRVGCPYADKMRKIIENNNMQLSQRYIVKTLDINSDQGKMICSKYGINGTPTFLCLKTGKTSVGFKPLDKHVKTLTEENKEKLDDTSTTTTGYGTTTGNYGTNNSDYIVVGFKQCPFCAKMLNYLDSKNISYSFVDSKSDEGRKHMGIRNANGVPLTINVKTNNHTVGYSEELP